MHHKNVKYHNSLKDEQHKTSDHHDILVEIIGQKDAHGDGDEFKFSDVFIH